MIKKIIILSLIISVFFLFLNFDYSFAACDPDNGEVCLESPIPNTDPATFIGKIINVSLGLAGSLALLMFIYGGFTWMLAAGNDQRVTKGKNILTWATVGLVTIFTSYALVKFVLDAIGGGA